MTIVGLPLVASASLVVASRRIRWSTAHRVTLAVTGLTALLALALLRYPEGGRSVAIEWLPGSGPMGLTTGVSSVYAVLVTSGTGFLALLGTASRGAALRPLSGAVTLLALAAANTAFLADHFLARYVALEVVALCVALIPLIELRDSVGTRLASSGYLLLRVGDAGLLAAILILEDASGTLSIDPALAHALSAIGGEARLGWMVAGFALAAWAKLGGWPFHLWSQAGRRLPLASQAWLYAILVPNLGAYLLYRVTPLLVLAGPVQVAALWLGAGGAALAALIALAQPAPRSALVYVGAAQGGLALFVASAGVKPAVWLGILALTPVRLLLFLAADVARNAASAKGRGLGAFLFGLGGLALVAFSSLTTWWAQEPAQSPIEGVRVPLYALFVAQAAVALIAAWTVRTVWRLSMDVKRPQRSAEEATHWTRWATVGLLGCAVLAGGLAFGPLVRHLVATGPVALPTFLVLLRYVATAPALLAALALGLGAWWVFPPGPSLSPPSSPPLGGKEGGEGGLEVLARAARVLRTVVEVGVAERIVALVVRAVVGGARFARAVEHKGLEGFTSRAARAVMSGAQVAHRAVEQEGLEGILRCAVRVLMAQSRVLQRWHTGRLRRNLLWFPIALALGMLALVVLGW